MCFVSKSFLKRASNFDPVHNYTVAYQQLQSKCRVPDYCCCCVKSFFFRRKHTEDDTDIQVMPKIQLGFCQAKSAVHLKPNKSQQLRLAQQ